MKILFIAGWGRSGSTLLGNILGSAPGVLNVGELRYLWRRGILEGKPCGCGLSILDCPVWAETLRRVKRQVPGLKISSMDAWVGAGAIRKQHICQTVGASRIYRVKAHQEIEALATTYREARHLTDSEWVVDTSKVAPYALALPYDSAEIHVLHLTRHPAAVAHSWQRRKATLEVGDEYFPRFSTLRSSAYWLLYNGLAPTLQKESTSYLTVRYEDLCRAPATVIEGICDYFSIRLPDLLDKFTVGLRAEGLHSVSGNPSRYLTGAVRVTADDAWRSNMPSRDIRLATTLTRPVARRYGYN